MDVGPGGISSPGPSGYGGGYDATTTGPSGGGGNGDSNDPYLGFVEASKPRGLSAIDRAVRDTVQSTKDFLSNPVNKRGILGGLLGGVLFGPLGALVGGSLGQRYGGTVSSFFQGRTPNTANTEIDMLTRSGMLQNQFLMPQTKVGITNIDTPNFPNFPEGMELYADASLKNQNRQLLENILNPDFKIDEALDKEQFKQDRQKELLNEILIG